MKNFQGFHYRHLESSNISIRRIFILFAVLTFQPQSIAATAVLGPSSASLCFQNARDNSRDLASCNEAINTDQLLTHELAATYTNRGIIQLRKGAIDLALKDHSMAIELKPDQAQAYINRGNAYLKGQQYGEALDDYQSAIERSEGLSHSDTARYAMALTYLRMSRKVDAVATLEALLQHNPEHLRARRKLDSLVTQPKR